MPRRTRAWIGAGVIIAALVLSLELFRREAPPPPYTPGLGEIMTLNQMRHAKLWLAGQAGNWPLAAYEIDELEEGFQDVMAFHPMHKDSPVPLREVIPIITGGPLRDLKAAVGKQDAAAFSQAFDALTNACNRCHQTTNFGFNVVTRPTGNPFSNQDFAPRH
jgi:hypothetical protein